MDIKTATEELYRDLTSKFDEVNGAGFRDGTIIIYLTESNENVLSNIPATYEEHTVIVEEIGIMRTQNV